MSDTDFRLDHHIWRKAISPSLKLLDHLGLIEIEPGPRRANIFKLSNRWRTVDAVEAARLSVLARELKPLRVAAPKLEKPAPAPKPVKVERPRMSERRIVSLPKLSFMDDGR